MEIEIVSEGSRFEEQLFGFTVPFDKDNPPAYLDFESSMREIIKNPCYIIEEDGSPRFYDSAKPEWGETRKLWFEVNRRLPRLVGKFLNGPLHLYIALGTSLDYWHGVDAFFFWGGAYITVDASIGYKSKDYPRNSNFYLKADYLVMPIDLEPEGGRLGRLATKMANRLEAHRTKMLERKKRRYNIELVE